MNSKSYIIGIVILLLLLLCSQNESFTQYKVYGQPQSSLIPNTILRAKDYILYPAYRDRTSFGFFGNEPRALPNINWFGSCACTDGKVCENQCNQGQPVCNGNQCKCGSNTQYGCRKTANAYCA